MEIRARLTVLFGCIVCASCTPQPHQKPSIFDRYAHDSGYWTRYNKNFGEDFWATSTPTHITFYLTNISQMERKKPVFATRGIPYFIDVEYKGAAVSQLKPYIRDSLPPMLDDGLKPGQTALGTFTQDEISEKYWADTYLRPVLWKEGVHVRFNFNGIVSNICVVRKHPHIDFPKQWSPKTTIPIYFDCSAPTTPSARLKDNKKRIGWLKRMDKDLKSYDYNWAN